MDLIIIKCIYQQHEFSVTLSITEVKNSRANRELDYLFIYIMQESEIQFYSNLEIK
jgi:hypothetical protein